jgi:hypothetical protein
MCQNNKNPPQKKSKFDNNDCMNITLQKFDRVLLLLPCTYVISTFPA